MDVREREGSAVTLRAAALIVVVGIGLGLAFNAVGLDSRPQRGLPWIAQPERMPSLEDLQPVSDAVPVVRPRPFAGFALVGTAWAGSPAPGDSAKVTVKPAPAKTTKAATVRATAKTTKAPVQPARNRTQPVKPAIRQTGAAPAAPAAPAAAPARVDLPVVPDLDQPIEVKLASAKRFFDAGAAAVVVDAREPVEYAAGHIAGARSLPYEAVTAKPELIDPFRKLGRPIILYCGVGCETSHELAKFMVGEGIRKVLVFTDGFEVWQAAGYPVEKGAAGAKR